MVGNSLPEADLLDFPYLIVDQSIPAPLTLEMEGTMLDPLVEDGCTWMVLLSKDRLVGPLRH